MIVTVQFVRVRVSSCDQVLLCDDRRVRVHACMAVCPLCTFEACSFAVILSHLRLVHSNDVNFSVICGLGGCATTSKSFSALYSHIYRHHSEVIKKRGGKGREEVDSDDHQPLCSLPTDERVDETSIEGNHCWFYGHGCHRFSRFSLLDWN